MDNKKNKVKLSNAIRYCMAARDCRECNYKLDNNCRTCAAKLGLYVGERIEALEEELKEKEKSISNSTFSYLELDRFWKEKYSNLEAKVPKEGYWIYYKDEILGDSRECSVCCTEQLSTGDYCSICGAHNIGEAKIVENRLLF